MNYTEYGARQEKIILLLHGGGLGPWNFREEAKRLEAQYHVILPVLDGHSGSDRAFSTIGDNADEIIHFIDEKCSGSVFLIGGLSLGGQILAEILSKRPEICQFAILESALVLPMRATHALMKPAIALCYPLVKKRWFAKLQFESLHIHNDYFPDYYRDSAAITKESMLAFLGANANYQLKESMEACRVKTLILVGSRESGIMKRSAEMLHHKIPNSALEILPGYHHGDLSLNHPEIYIQKLYSLMTQNACSAK